VGTKYSRESNASIFAFAAPCQNSEGRNLNFYNFINIKSYSSTGLFEMIVGVVTTCHTQYT